MSISIELAAQIKEAISVRGGGTDNETLNAVAEELSLTEDQIVSYMFGDVEEDVQMWSDEVVNDYIEPSMRVDLSSNVITSENYEEYAEAQAQAADDSDDDDDLSIPNTIPNAPQQMPSMSAGTSLEDIMADMQKMNTQSVPAMDIVEREMRDKAGDLDSYVYKDEGDGEFYLIPPEDPSMYVFAALDNGSGEKGFTIFLKSYWDKTGLVDDREVEPTFLDNADFQCTSESQWENHGMPHVSAIKVLRNLGLTEITLP